MHVLHQALTLGGQGLRALQRTQLFVAGSELALARGELAAQARIGNFHGPDGAEVAAVNDDEEDGKQAGGYIGRQVQAFHGRPVVHHQQVVHTHRQREREPGGQHQPFA